VRERRRDGGTTPITTVRKEKPVETVEDPRGCSTRSSGARRTDIPRGRARAKPSPKPPASGDDRVDSGSHRGLVVERGEGHLVAEAHDDLHNARKTDLLTDML
jgi:hypothetical protein